MLYSNNLLKGKPKSNNFMGLDNNEVSDDAWEVKDYVEN